MRAERRFILALILTGLILVVEVVGGLVTHSLALLSDAGHVLLDMLALGMSYAALRLAARPADDRHSYGFHRFQVLAALANGVLLFLMAFGILREAWARFRSPEPVLAGPRSLETARRRRGASTLIRGRRGSKRSDTRHRARCECSHPPRRASLAGA